MSGASVLYDVPGQKAKTRNRLYSVLGSLAVLGLIAFAFLRLNSRGSSNPRCGTSSTMPECAPASATAS